MHSTFPSTPLSHTVFETRYSRTENLIGTYPNTNSVAAAVNELNPQTSGGRISAHRNATGNGGLNTGIK